MKVGDLVILDVSLDSSLKSGPYIITYVTPTKKSWHRLITMYYNNGFIDLPWTRKDMLKIINQESGI